MNEYVEALILGIVQGLTEFLPVSSSGHLELAKWLLGDTHSASESFLMTVVLHFGTALATVWVFRQRVLEVLKNITQASGRNYLLYIILSMIPAALAGVLLDDQIEALFQNQIILVSICLCITGIILLLSDRVKSQQKEVGALSAFVIGIAQAIAILPGISRSGSTIATGIGFGIKRKEVAQFSFLMVIPLIFGKMAKDTMDGDLSSVSSHPLPLLLGFAASFFVGIVACKWMVTIVQHAQLKYFAYYCLAVGIIAILIRLFIFKS